MSAALDDPLLEPLARFGLSSFRPGQREVIQAVMDGKDALCIMPTGGGKSLCYQLPAVARGGLTLVVSPLIALMKDQVDALAARGIAATFVNSSLTQSEQLQRIERMASGEYDLVYIAPERLRSSLFLEKVRESNVQLLAVDEAHCISEWGHDFRPDYARLGRFRERLGFPQTIGLTATATPKVRADIAAQLRLREPAVFITGFARENLGFEVQHPVGGRDKFDALLSVVEQTPGAGIVYCSTRKRCAEVVELLRNQSRRIGRSVGIYHAGLEPDARRRVQDDFMEDRVPIIVATNAFGMGIDKSDLRFVVHYNMPGNLEAYYQEAGRAGRDGLPSRCMLLFSGEDRIIQEFFIDNKFPPREAVQKVYDLLRRIDADPIELTLEEIKDKLGLKITSEGVGACEKLLERAGVLERLDTRENRAAVRIDSDLPTLVDFLSPEAKVQRRVLSAIEKLVGPMRHERVYIQPAALARLTELDQPAIGRAIKELQKLRDFDYVPPFRGRAVHMLRRDMPFSQLDIDWQALDERKAAEYEKLDRVVRYAYAHRCRQAEILDYFGDQSAHQCGVCDNCRPRQRPPLASQPQDRLAVADDPLLVEAVRMVLSGIARARGRFGKNLVAEMLVGGTTKKILRTSLTQVSTYGLLRGVPARSVAGLIDLLIVQRLVSSISSGDVRRPLVNLTELGGSVMRGKSPPPAGLSIERGLAAALKSAVQRRKPLAAPASQPEACPQPVKDRDEWDPREGVGSRFESAAVTSSESLARNDSRPLEHKPPPNKLPHHWTWQLLARGFSPEDCLAIRQIDEGTLYEHLLRAAKEGMPVNPHWIVSPETWQRLADFLGDVPPEQVKDRLGELPPGITYRDVQWYVVARGQGAEVIGGRLRDAGQPLYNGRLPAPNRISEDPMPVVTDRLRTDAVYLHPDDNIAVAARNLEKGTELKIAGVGVRLAEPIKIGHKIAVRPIAKGAEVRKYGQIIGLATAAVEPGQWVHSHNLHIGEFARDYAKAQHVPPDPTPITDRTFMGYQRAGGKAGTRNYIAVISTVNCSASVCKFIAERFDKSILRDYPNIDGVVAFKHAGGCGMQYQGLQHEILNRTMAGIARHPNIGGYLLIGLGCEQGAMGYLLQSQGLVQIEGNGSARQAGSLPYGVPVLSMQDMGGTVKTVEAGVRMIADMLPRANDVQRVPIPASEIILGTNCGGSDGNSGVTCNPALGVASDMIVACGGTTVLAETTEIYGAEHLLTRRAKTPAIADKLLERIQWWLWHTGLYGVEIDSNPSVGNKEGGLTTIAEKSLGAVAKAGSTAMTEVYQYAEPVTAKGLVVMDTPGFDAPSVTGLMAGGCNVIVFTTGRGSCIGLKPTPSIKVASNTPMYERMEGDMDLNCGEVLHGRSIEDAGREIFEKILAVASGEKTKSELHGIGDEEFVPWQVGPTL